MILFDGIALLLPALGIMLRLRSPAARPATLVVLCYLYPLLAILMMGGGGYALPGVAIGPATANAARVVVHLAAFAGLAVAVAWRNRLTVSTASILAAGTGAVVLMCISALVAGNNLLVTAAGRAIILGTMITSVLLLLPSALGPARTGFCAQFARSFGMMVGLVVLVAIYARIVHGPFPEWTPRFGRPLNARVMGNLVLLAALLLTVYTDRLRWAVASAGVIAATGSRLALAALLGFLIVMAWQRRRYAVFAIGAAAMVGAGALVASGSGLQVFARSGPLAGRVIVWGAAIQDLPDHLVWGIGERYTVFRTDVGEDEPQIGRLHNGPFEATLSHGVGYALLVFGVYGVIVYRVLRWRPSGPQGARDRQMARWVVLAVLAESMVGTALWTNLGDAFSLGALTVLGVAASRATSERA